MKCEITIKINIFFFIIMDETKSLSQSILQSSESGMSSGTSPYVSYESSSSDSGFFNTLKNINITTWILIILILAFFGFNIFTYLSKGTQWTADIFGKLSTVIFGASLETASQAIDVSAEGAKAVVGGTSNAVQGGLSALQDATPNKIGSSSSSTFKGEPINQEQEDVIQQSSLNKALNTSLSLQSNEQDYQANEASSSVHSSKKTGWCYIGADRGFRTCAEVGVNDQCMSGDIFPSQEICMNPSLRA